jgi:hypothetical protein
LTKYPNYEDYFPKRIEVVALLLHTVEAGYKFNLRTRRKAKMVQVTDLLRYGLWSLMAATANANRREFRMATTWLPHFVLNTFTLFLPELYNAIVPREELSGSHNDAWSDIRHTLDAMIRDNPEYAIYVAPIPIGYILSHPRFNIYKGEMAEIRFLGLGLDALPHGITAFTMTSLFCESTEKGASNIHSHNPVSEAIEESAQHPATSSGILLVLATLWWEVGEYMIHRHELALRGDITKINMMWSLPDTLNDCFANFLGWALALGLRSLKDKRRIRA